MNCFLNPDKFGILGMRIKNLENSEKTRSIGQSIVILHPFHFNIDDVLSLSNFLPDPSALQKHPQVVTEKINNGALKYVIYFFASSL